MPSAEAELLEANATFYRAFAEHDVALMDALWSRTSLVACIHPGWPPLYGRGDVMQSWDAILTSEQAPDVECSEATPMIMGEMALVICSEEIADTKLTATNVFVREQGVWKMVHHHAGLCSPRSAISEAPDPSLN